MNPIKEVYPDAKEEYCMVYDYDPLLESLGYEIKLKQDDDSYQGDSRLLLYNEVTTHWGLLIFGWGSCSGCDALQACSTWKEIEELRLELLRDIHWENTAESLREYVEKKDWELEWAWHAEETKKFVQDALKLLKGE